MSDSRADFAARLARLPEREVLPPDHASRQLDRKTLWAALDPISPLICALVGFVATMVMAPLIFMLAVKGDGSNNMAADFEVAKSNALVLLGGSFIVPALVITVFGWTKRQHYQSSGMGVAFGLIILGALVLG